MYCGSSGGALVAAVLALGIDPDQVLEQILGFVRHCRKSYFNAFKIRGYVVRCIDHFNKVYEKNRERLLSGAPTPNLNVAVSILPQCRRVMINSFDGVDELREALVASCCMTPLAGWPFQIKDPTANTRRR